MAHRVKHKRERERGNMWNNSWQQIIPFPVEFKPRSARNPPFSMRLQTAIVAKSEFTGNYFDHI